MSKYAPAREDGLKPWVVTKSEWGRQTGHLVYAATASDAAYQMKGRMRYVTARARRAIPEDMQRFHVEPSA